MGSLQDQRSYGSIVFLRWIACLFFSIQVSACQPAAKNKQDESQSKAISPAKQSEIESRLTSVSASLRVVDEQGSRSRDLTSLLGGLQPRLVKTMDPHYKREKQFYGVQLARLITQLWPDLAGADPKDAPDFEFQALDGYKVRLSMALAQNPAAFLVFADKDHASFEPVGERALDPAPLYLVWEGNELTDLTTHPRPWGITQLRRLRPDQDLELTIPQNGFGTDQAAKGGHVLFARDCIRCHSINQQGGKLGPDLNIPQNILEYRPEDQVRAYIKDPLTFRYGLMPAHPNLSEADLDQLIAYLRAMGRSKVDSTKVK